MTPLRTPISRKTPIQMDNRRELRDRDQIVVTLYPGGIIGFRALRCRKEHTLPLSKAYLLAVEQTVREEKRARAEAKKRKDMQHED